jgi:hypothetical protein
MKPSFGVVLAFTTALTLVLAWLTSCTDPQTGPPKPPGRCLPGVRPVPINTCGNLITPDLKRCRECDTGAGCYVAGDDVYCVDQHGCLDPFCGPSPIPIGLKRAPNDGGK